MSRKKKIFAVTSVFILLFLFFLLSLNYLASTFINLELVKAKIQKAVSTETGGSVEYGSIDISLFPFANAVIHNAKISLPGNTRGTLKRMDIHPEILPLFTGALVIKKILVDSPDFRITLSEEDIFPDNLTAPVIRDGIVSLVSYLASAFPQIRATINEGNFIFTEAGRDPFVLKRLEADIDFSPGKLKAAVNGASSAGENISITARFDKTDLKGWGEVRVKRFRPDKLPGWLLPFKNGLLGESKADVTLGFLFDDSGMLHADLDSSIPLLTIRRGDDELAIKGGDINVSYRLDREGVTAALEKLKLVHPGIGLSGVLFMNREGVRLDLKGKNIDVISVHDTARILKDIALLSEDIFPIVKGGRIPEISYRGKGASFGDLANRSNYVIEGRMEAGKVHVPDIALDLTGVDGDIIISNGVLEAKGIRAARGNSRILSGSLKLGLEGEDPPLHLDVMVEADLSEIPSLLKKTVDSESFTKELDLIDNPEGHAGGRLVMEGSLHAMETRIDVPDVRLSARYGRIPFPLEIRSGGFHYDEAGVKLENIKGSVGASSISDLSCRINFQKPPFLEIPSGSGEVVMDELYPWLSRVMKLKNKSIIRSPLTLSQIHLIWDRSGGNAVKGQLALQNGPDISFDIFSDGDEFSINSLSLHDAESDARLSLAVKESDISIMFAGRIDHSTINKVLPDNTILKNRISGDFSARVAKDRPYRFTANGELEGSGISVPLNMNGPVRIHNFILDASKNRININSTDMNLDDMSIDLEGSVTHSGEGFIIDTHLSTGGIEWDRLKKLLEPDKEGRTSMRLSGIPAEGTIRLNSESFTYDRFTAGPFRADIELGSGNIKVNVMESLVCGISTPGSLLLTSDDMSLDFELLASEKGMHDSLKCLWDMEKRLTGLYDLDATITGQERSDNLLKSMEGTLELSVTDGRIYEGGILAKLLSFINVTEIFRGQVPDLVNEGFAYNTMTARGTLDGHTFTLEEWKLNASNMNMVGEGTINIEKQTVDLDILVAPLKTVDFIIGKIPVIRDILGGTLVSIPIKVKGDIVDPEMDYLPPSAVGKGLLDTLKNTLQVPVKILDPIIPE